MKNESWGNLVRTLRHRKGISRSALAKIICVDYSYISRIESYGYVPSREIVISIANTLEYDVDELLLLAGYAPKDSAVESVIHLLRWERTEGKRVMEQFKSQSAIPELNASLGGVYALSTAQQYQVCELLTEYVQNLA